MNVAKDIEQAKKDAEAKAAEAERLAKLLELHPDLQKRVGRWSKTAYYSKTANAVANGVDMRHNCGCCPDSPVEAWPFYETEHGRVYTDPPMFRVGERDDYANSGERANDNWDTGMRAAGIPETVIDRVGAWLGAEPRPAHPSAADQESREK